MKQYEFESDGVVFSTGLFNRKRLKYADIVSVERKTFLQIVLRSFALFKRPLVSMRPLGVSWYCVLIETENTSFAVMLNNSETFVSALRQRI